MFFQAVKNNRDMVRDYEVLRHQRFGGAYQLVARIILMDESVLHVKDYLFANGQRKYSYHWQDKWGNLRQRWDNSPHHPDIPTYPHHLHGKDTISESAATNLIDVLHAIRRQSHC